MTVPAQSGVNYAYDNANRLLRIVQGSSTVSFAYDAGSQRTSLTLPNGVVMSYSYDNASQLTGISYTHGSTNLGSLTYGYDLAGRRTSMGGTLAQTALPLGVSEAEYNADNQLTEWGTAGLYYDANGNMTSDGLNSFNWNARNQLASMNFGADSFQYDGYGRRVGKTISGTTTNYLYDRTNIVQELSGSTVTANLLAGLGVDERFLRADSSGAPNFLTDALGSTIAMTNSSGSNVVQYTYDPFGNTTVTSGGSTNSYEYTGRENDGTGVYFYRGRCYSPTLQRFMSEDPIGFGGGQVNLYAYVGNNPLNLIDPTGMDGYSCMTAYGPGLCVTDTETQWQYYIPCMAGRKCQDTPPEDTPPPPQSQVPSNTAQKKQDCLNEFNNSPDGKFYNFMSMLSPILGPERVKSLIEDTAGPASKYAILKGYQYLGYESLFEGAEWLTKEAVLPLSVAATVGQITGHVGCAIASHF